MLHSTDERRCKRARSGFLILLIAGSPEFDPATNGPSLNPKGPRPRPSPLFLATRAPLSIRSDRLSWNFR